MDHREDREDRDENNKRFDFAYRVGGLTGIGLTGPGMTGSVLTGNGMTGSVQTGPGMTGPARANKKGLSDLDRQH